MKHWTVWFVMALLAGSASAQLRVKPRDIDTTSTYTWNIGGVTVGPNGALSWTALLNPSRLSSDTPSNGDVLRWLTGGTTDWLALGNAAVKDVGTTTGTVAAGDHTHAGADITSGVVGKTYGGAGDVNGILKANGSGTVSAVAAGGIADSLLTSNVPLLNAANTFTGKITAVGGINIGAGGTKASNAAGTAGDLSWDADYFYVCTATDTWKRAALTGGY